jgi:hypothetical protein
MMILTWTTYELQKSKNKKFHAGAMVGNTFNKLDNTREYFLSLAITICLLTCRGHQIPIWKFRNLRSSLGIQFRVWFVGIFVCTRSKILVEVPIHVAKIKTTYFKLRKEIKKLVINNLVSSLVPKVISWLILLGKKKKSFSIFCATIFNCNMNKTFTQQFYQFCQILRFVMLQLLIQHMIILCCHVIKLF